MKPGTGGWYRIQPTLSAPNLSSVWPDSSTPVFIGRVAVGQFLRPVLSSLLCKRPAPHFSAMVRLHFPFADRVISPGFPPDSCQSYDVYNFVPTAVRCPASPAPPPHPTSLLFLLRERSRWLYLSCHSCCLFRAFPVKLSHR